MVRRVADKTASPANHSLTLERGLRVLRVLAEHPDGLSVSALAAEMETHRAGIYRLLGPLVDQRLVVRDADGRHTLGVGLIELGQPGALAPAAGCAARSCSGSRTGWRRRRR